MACLFIVLMVFLDGQKFKLSAIEFMDFTFSIFLRKIHILGLYRFSSQFFIFFSFLALKYEIEAASQKKACSLLPLVVDDFLVSTLL